MPRNTGMAFAVIQHLSPDFKSVIDELLARRTRIPILQAANGANVEPDTVYLMPARKEMIIKGGKLLIGNATSYSDEGAKVHVTLKRDGDDIVLTVRDQGVGIDHGLLPHIFELFVQGEQKLDRSRVASASDSHS
jgi:K+-sensing histidine kinase KdpD